MNIWYNLVNVVTILKKWLAWNNMLDICEIRKIPNAGLDDNLTFNDTL